MKIDRRSLLRLPGVVPFAAPALAAEAPPIPLKSVPLISNIKSGWIDNSASELIAHVTIRDGSGNRIEFDTSIPIQQGDTILVHSFHAPFGPYEVELVGDAF